MIEKNAKFTATMTFNSDKEFVQQLREELQLGEKETMHFIIKTAMQNRELLESMAREYGEELAKEKAEKKALQLAAYKAKYAELRAAMKKVKVKGKSKKA